MVITASRPVIVAVGARTASAKTAVAAHADPMEPPVLSPLSVAVGARMAHATMVVAANAVRPDWLAVPIQNAAIGV